MSVTGVGIPGTSQSWGNWEVRGEDLSSQCDDSTTTFTVTNTYKAGSLTVYLNGQRLSDEVTEVTGTTFSIDTAPFDGDILIVDYYY